MAAEREHAEYAGDASRVAVRRRVERPDRQMVPDVRSEADVAGLASDQTGCTRLVPDGFFPPEGNSERTGGIREVNSRRSVLAVSTNSRRLDVIAVANSKAVVDR